MKKISPNALSLVVAKQQEITMLRAEIEALRQRIAILESRTRVLIPATPVLIRPIGETLL